MLDCRTYRGMNQLICVVRCFFKRSLTAKDLSQRWQEYGFAPVWTVMCILYSPIRPNTLLQKGHVSSVTHVCFLKLPLLINCFPHPSQETTCLGFLTIDHWPFFSLRSPWGKWINRCFVKSFFEKKIFRQTEHVRSGKQQWLVTPCIWANRLWHFEQEYLYNEASFI